MIGTKFGKWTVLDYAGKKFNNRYQFLCRCECGKESVLHGPSLRQGLTKQCLECRYRAQKGKAISQLNESDHGMSRSPLYKIWSSMKNRCICPTATHYYRYGGRGIKVCDRWQQFENFYKDMGERPEGLTLDRIDNDGDYSKENCRWVSHQENCQNRFYDKREQ
jgi:hypothetical protein